MSLKNWYRTSEKLDEEVKLWELIEALLSEEKIESEEILKEKHHWWKFLEQVSSIPIEKLKEEASKINEQFEHEIEKEVKYCKLLNLKPFKCQFVSSQLKKQLKDISSRTIPDIIFTDAYTIRWIYTFQCYNEAKIPDDKHGNKITTIRSDIKKDKIRKKEIKKLFRRACYCNPRNGTPKEYSEELLEVDLSKL